MFDSVEEAAECISRESPQIALNVAHCLVRGMARHARTVLEWALRPLKLQAETGGPSTFAYPPRLRHVIIPPGSR